MEKNTFNSIQSLDRGLHLLEILVGDEGDLGVTELSRKIGVDKSTAYRLLSTMQSRGYVRQNQETKKYGAGLKVVELSTAILNKMRLRQIAQPFLKTLVRETDETAHLAILVQEKVVYIDREKSQGVISINTEVGAEAPPHCTAIGKVILAYVSEEELSSIVKKKDLHRYTPKTITSLTALKLHLRKVRESGYAFDDEEFNPGVRCLAVPIRNHRGEVIASIGISGPASRIVPDRVPQLVEIIKNIADQVSMTLGHRSNMRDV